MWLRRRIDAVLGAPGTGLVQCGHLAPGDKATVAVWRPGRAWCWLCAPAGVRIDDPGEDRRCDRCQKIGRMIYPMLADAGSAYVLFGLCANCRRREVGDDHD